MSERAKQRVFVSYGRHDARSVEFANKLSSWLKSQGYVPWLDVDQGIPIGSPFDIRIELGIQQCSVMIALLSASSLRPDSFCRNELLYAQAHHIPIIPVRIADVVPPVQIISLNYVDVAADPESLFDSLHGLIERVGADGAMRKRDWPDLTGDSGWWSELPHLSFEAELARYGVSFVGREWIFDTVAQWSKLGAARLFLLSAPMGLGKSALVARMTAKLNVRGVHFCNLSDHYSCRPSTWIAGLLFQLAAQFPAYRDRIRLMAPPNWNEPLSAFRSIVAQPLHECRNQFDTADPWLFAIDGLDESYAALGPSFADFLADCIEILPPWFRLVVTSRPEQSLLARFKVPGARTYDLEPGGSGNAADLSNYIAERLGVMTHIPAPRRAGVQAQLSDAAAGNFLFARLTLDALESSSADEGLEADQIGALPRQLGGLYHAMFRRRFPDEGHYRRVLLPLLECLVAARAPLPETVLIQGADTTEHDTTDALRQLAPFLARSEEGMHFAHRSLADWLVDSDAAGTFLADATNGHKRFSDFGMACYRQDGTRSLSDYLRQHLPAHLAARKRWDDLLLLVNDPELDLLSRWTDRGEGDDGVLCLTGLIGFLSEQDSKSIRAAELATQLARIHSVRGAYADAEDRLGRALNQLPMWHGRRARVIANHELASIALYRGDLARAKRLYRRALVPCLLGIPLFPDEASANLIALALLSLLDFRQRPALRLARLAQRFADRANDLPHTVAARCMVATALKATLDFEQAEQLLSAAELIAGAADLPREKARALLARARLRYVLDIVGKTSLTEPEALFNRAMSESTRAQDNAMHMSAMLGLAECALAQRQTDTAQEWLERVTAMLGATPPYDIPVAVLFLRAAVSHQRGDFPIAVATYEQAASQAERYGLRALQANAWVGIGMIQWHTGKNDQAEHRWATAMQLAASCSEHRHLLVRLSISQGRTDPKSVPY